MELINHVNTEIHIYHEITEIPKFVLKNELLTYGNMEKLPVLIKEVKKLQKYRNLQKSINTKLT